MAATRIRMRQWLPWLSCLLLMAAVFQPTIDRRMPVHRYLLVFDISQSMNVEDVVLEEQNLGRLAGARQFGKQLLQGLPCGSEIGLGIFAASKVVTLLTPLEVCAHYHGLSVAMDSIDDRMRFKNASSVGKGLHQSLRAAAQLGENTSVIMFTDGHEAPPLRHGQTGLPKSEGHDVDGFIIGIGGDQPRPIPRVDNNGQPQGFWQADDVTQLPADERTSRSLPGEEFSALQEAHLQQLGQLSGLRYLRLTQISPLLQQISNRQSDLERQTPVNVAWIPASLSLLAFLLYFLPRGAVPPGHL